MIREGVAFGKEGEKTTKRVVRLNDLSLADEIVRKSSFEEALIHAKFYNGESNFNERERMLIAQLLKNS